MTRALMPGRWNRDGRAVPDPVVTPACAGAELDQVKFSEFCGAAAAVLVVTVIAIACSVAWLILGDHP